MRIFRNKFFLLSFALILTILAYFSFLLISSEVKHKKYENNFALIKIGNGKEFVTSKMGESSKIEKCYYISSEDVREEAKKYLEQCKNIYSYISLLEIYDISFDKDNRVIDKNNKISP